MTTTTGRVVYNRKTHWFKLSNVLQIIKKINNNYSPGEKGFGSWFEWRAIARISANNAALLGNEDFDSLSYAVHYGTGKTKQVEEKYRLLAYFIHYIREISKIVGLLASKLPFVKEVWEFGSPILEWAVSEANKKLGSWAWDDKTNAPIFY